MRTLVDILAACRARGDAPAVIAFGEDTAQTVSHAELAARAASVAAGLAARGIARGERVGICAANGADWIAAALGAVAAGAVAAPIDAQASDEDVVRMLSLAGCRILFTTAARHERLLSTPGAPAATAVLLDAAADGGAGAIGLADILAEAAEPVPAAPDGLAVMFFTSGTTGPPKGVPLTHANLVSNLDALKAAHLVEPGDRVLLPLPLHHAYPFTVGLLGALDHGAAILLPAGRTGPQLLAAARQGGATVMLAVPRLLQALLAGVERRLGTTGRAALSLAAWLFRRAGLRIGRPLFAPVRRRIAPSLRLLVSGGAALDADTAERLVGLGFRVLSGYGLTETAPIVTFNLPRAVRLDTAGRTLPGVGLRTDRESGEILVRGPNVFAGYWRDPDKTRAAFTEDGWLRTGDLGALDADGYLHILGRLGERIVLPNGEAVEPERIEAAYAESPLIREVGVFAGARGLAAVVVPEERWLREHGAARLKARLREEVETRGLRLRAYERVGEVAVSRDPLPRTTLGKLQRYRLPGLYRAADATAAAEREAEEEAPVAPEDRALLERPLAGTVWAWLAERFPDRRLRLDTSPQLDLGFDSLSWLDLSLELRERFGRDLDEEAIGRILTLRDLLREIEAAPPARAPAPRAAVAPASPWLVALGATIYGLVWLGIRAPFRLRVVGRGALTGEGPFVFVPNHSSYLDPFALAAALPFRLLRRTHWAGWTQILFAGPLRRLFSRATQVLPIDPESGGRGGIEAARAILAQGRSLVWFAEGRRSPDGSLHPFHPGIGLVLRGAGAARVVPVRILGTHRALPPGAWWPRPTRITVIVGAPQRAATLVGEACETAAPQRIADALHAAVAALTPEAGAQA